MSYFRLNIDVNKITKLSTKIGINNIQHEDAWELGTGINYSINEVYEMFREKFGVEKIHISDQNGNYRETIRKNNDALDRLGCVGIETIDLETLSVIQSLMECDSTLTR